VTDQTARQGPTTTLPPQSASGTSSQLPPAAAPAKAGRTHTRISGMRTNLIAAVGTARITELRRIMRRDRRRPQSG